MPTQPIKHASNWESPARSAEELTPDNVTNLDVVTRALYVGGGGDISVAMDGGPDPILPVLFLAVPTGTILPIRIKRLRATDTTATSIIALY